MKERIELHSPHPPEECAARIAAAIDRQSWPFSHGSRPLVGRVAGSYVELRKRIPYANSFQRFLVAHLRKDGAGTLIEGHVGQYQGVTVFIWLWFAGLALMAGIVAAFAELDTRAKHPESEWEAIGFIGLMAGFGALVVVLGRHLARDEPKFLRDFLKQMLDATDRS